MKVSDVIEYELGEHCFGPIVKVNGIHNEDISKEDKIELLNDVIMNDDNGELLLDELFIKALEFLDYSVAEESSDRCDQCGNWNSYGRFVKDG